MSDRLLVQIFHFQATPVHSLTDSYQGKRSCSVQHEKVHRNMKSPPSIHRARIGTTTMEYQNPEASRDGPDKARQKPPTPRQVSGLRLETL